MAICQLYHDHWTGTYVGKGEITNHLGWWWDITIGLCLFQLLFQFLQFLFAHLCFPLGDSSLLVAFDLG